MAHIIYCPNCNTKNRLATNTIYKTGKCGNCNSEILNTIQQQVCILCYKNHSNNTSKIDLSDGSYLHSSCLQSLQTEISETMIRINTLKKNKKDLIEELSKRDGVIFKIGSFFSSPKIDTRNYEISLNALKPKLKQARSHFIDLNHTVTSVYDYWLTYPPDWENRKQLISADDGHHCSQCLRTKRLHLHHMVPLSKGGSNRVSNLKFLCEKCHSKAHGGKTFKSGSTCSDSTDIDKVTYVASYERSTSGGTSFSGSFSDTETAYSKRISIINQAIKAKRKVKFSYKKPRASNYRERVVKPSALENLDHTRSSESTLCVRGHCELRNDERVFALKRMQGLKML